MNGQIIKILSNDYTVSSNDKIYTCKSRGNFRNKNITPKVGDYVFFDEKNRYILNVLERKNSLKRPNVANVDQAIILTSLKEPDFSTNLLDKFLVICFANNIKPIICISKYDLVSKKEFRIVKKILNYYKKVGYKIVYNKKTGELKKLLPNKTTVFTGQTGSGKSTLINQIDRSLHFETGEISKALGRGRHTTRCVSLVEINHGKVLDTPGFSDIDLKEFKKEDILNSFIEFKKYNCPFKDCMHTFEKDCEIKKQVLKGKILKSRYDNYLKFIKEVL